MSTLSRLKEHFRQRQIRKTVEDLLLKLDFAEDAKEITQLEDSLLELTLREPYAEEVHEQYCALNLQLALLAKTGYFKISEQAEVPANQSSAPHPEGKMCA